MSDLLPCPFCGGEADLQVDEMNFADNSGIAMCGTCFSCGPCKDNWADAVVTWNTRATPDPTAAVIRALKMAASIAARRSSMFHGFGWFKGANGAANVAFEIRAVAADPEAVAAIVRGPDA